MKEKDKDTEVQIVSGILQNIGYSTERIPPSNKPKEQRADLRVISENNKYIVEVKTRLDHPNLMAEVEKAPDKTIVEYHKEIARSNTLSGIIQDGVQQLEATPKTKDEFCFIWFRCIETHMRDTAALIRATVYGIRQLLINISETLPCYYFDFNEFYNRPTLDAIIVEENENETNKLMLLNNFSVKYKNLCRSDMYQFFEKDRAVIDPKKLEETESILIADTNHTRKEQNEIIKYLKKKYNIQNMQVLPMETRGGIIKTKI